LKVRINGEVKDYRTVWLTGKTVKMIDQRLLPHRFEIHEARNYRETAEAIRNMTVRGAGAIGVTGAFGVAQAALETQTEDLKVFLNYVENAAATLKGTRPTAVNLFHAIDRCLSAIRGRGTVDEFRELAVNEAQRIAEEDVEASRKIGEYGKDLIEDGFGILTHCNAGALAFIDYGTALSPIRLAHYEGKEIFVFVDETRPMCQGARLTAWELLQEGIKHAVIVDNAAGFYMGNENIQLVIVGADRIAKNGDVANKIGTYEKAALAKENRIPFYVAAPLMTFDPKCRRGKDIPIEERSPDEVLSMWGVNEKEQFTKVRIAPTPSEARNPAFDITPAKFVSGIITEKGIIRPPFKENILNLLSKSR
jgi:S-methyl-5-thioribose-1-phosphate isomerase